MNILIERYAMSDSGTFGHLFLNDKLFCCTAEPPSFGKYPIPEGTYKVAITHSNRFSGKEPYSKYAGVPLLLNVPNFEGIRIHVGNSPITDTQGCILVGLDVKASKLLYSVQAYIELMEELKNQSEISLTIKHILK